MSAGDAPAGAAIAAAGATSQSAPAAPLLRRAASMLYESLLLIGVLALTFMVPHMIIGLIRQASAPGWIEWLHLVAVLGIYCTWFWRHGGQTLAMRTWRIRLVDAVSGAPPSTSKTALRYGLCWPSIGLFGAGLIWALFDRDRQFLHDRLAGTRLIDLRK